MSKRQLHLRGAIDRQAEQEKKDGLKNLVFMVLGAIIAVGIGAIFYFLPFIDKSSQANGEIMTANQAQTESAQNKAPATYEFYEILPKQEFRGISAGMSEHAQTAQQPPNTKATAQQKKQEQTGRSLIAIPSASSSFDGAEKKSSQPSISIQKAQPNSTYILQVHSYETAEPAELKRGEVIMAGVEAEVVRREDGNGGVFYIVVSTPMTSRDEVMNAHNRLQMSGIDSLVVEQKNQ